MVKEGVSIEITETGVIKHYDIRSAYPVEMVRSKPMTKEELLRGEFPERAVDVGDIYITHCSGCLGWSHCSRHATCPRCLNCSCCLHCSDCIGIKNGYGLRYVVYGVQLTAEEFAVVKTKYLDSIL